MKINLINIFILLSTFLVNMEVYAQQDSFIKDYLERWETSKKYMLAVAEAMPEEKYGFRPAAEVMSFAEQAMHIAAVIDWHAFSKADGQEYAPRWEKFSAEGKRKMEILESLEREFRRSANLLADFDPVRLEETGKYSKYTRTRRQFFMLMTDHVTHHRAQMLIYLRLNGVDPPPYIEFQ